MQYKGQNIITDSDITMTGRQIGHSLSEVIDSQQDDINNLKSNVKWIYKYGGVGSGSGGGSGSGSTAPWNFRVEIDDAVRENGTTVNLGQQREYKLAIQLYKVQGRTFTIKYTYTTETGYKVTEKVIPPTQSSLLTDTINLQVNGTLSIAINDDEGNTGQFIMDYIVAAYNFTLNYAVSNGNPASSDNVFIGNVPNTDYDSYYPNNNNIFVSAVEQSGLVADLYSTIAVNIISGYIDCIDWEGNVIENIPLTKGSRHIYIPLGKEINNDNSGNYTFTVIPHLTLEGNSKEEDIQELKLTDNLIPSDIYLKVESDGILYQDSSNNSPYQFYAGAIPFYITPFQGFLDNSSTYGISVYLNGIKQDIDITELQDQIKYTINILTDVLEWNEIQFVINRKNQVYSKSYYFYTKSPLGSFNWYTENTFPIISYQHKYSSNIHDKAFQIPEIQPKSLIKYTSSKLAKTYAIPLNYDTYKAKDCLISIGIDYSKLNDTEKVIFEISGNTSSNNIKIYQDHITIGSTDYSNFYLPMSTSESHLISIYRRAVTESNNQPLFEFVVYIDGVMETATSGFITQQETYNKIEFNPGLYDVNYLEISYFEHTPVKEASSDLFEQYNPNPNKYKISYLTDSSILYHYYSYKLTFYPDSISDDFKNVYSYATQFHTNYKTGRTVVNRGLIEAVATTANVPVILLKYTEPRTDSNYWNSDGETFMQWLETRYDVTKDTGITDIAQMVEVSYSKGGEPLKDILTDANSVFYIYLQGTSTLNYSGKNLDLEIASKDPDYTYLYSPNFDDSDSSTFLPETRFTIKADIVDSSHSNNNAIGKFINTVTTKFEDAAQTGSKYSSYIKNALEGFPVLLFIQNSYFVNSTVNVTTDDFYFLGISNMNLGRDSEFNLGYKDLRLLPDTIENGFAITKIENDKKIDNNTSISASSYLPDFGVAEIRENRNYFDFSQSDPSILFEIKDSGDTDYMFSKFKSNSQDLLESSLQSAVEGVSKGGGFIFDSLGKNMLSSVKEGDKLGYGYDEGYKSEIPQNLVPNYKVALKRTFENATSVLTPTGNTVKGEQADLIRVLLGSPENSIDPLVDYKSLSEYYVICMALGLLDSVLKNLNLKKWKNKFYAAFYDMDTGLGKDNAGINSNYTCFSDYWEPKTSTLGGTTMLEPAMSYKDWFDKDIVGFDVPMTYLFALAKYAYQFGGTEELKDWYPNNLWARFRRSNKNIQGWTLPAKTNENHICCLETADKFIDNFYKKHLDAVPDVFFNLDYRTKYLKVNDLGNAFVDEEWKKLSGRRIHVVRDWLNSRFKLLDLYFNLAQVADSIQEYDMDSKTWKLIPDTTYTKPDSIFIDTNNDDITILQDTFSSGGGSTKYSSNVNVMFTSDDYSPLCLSGALIARYITKDNTTQYTLKVESAGKALNLGGSGSWLTLNSINSLIQGGAFYANSDKLTTLNGTSGQCSSWSLNLPALTSVSLTSSQYSGTLTFSGKDNWPNLSSITINNSKLGLNLDNLNVNTINASNVGVSNELIIANCPNLSRLNISNSVFTTISLSPVEAVSYFSKYTYTQNEDGTWKATNTIANPAKCKYLTLKRDNKDGIVFITDQTYNNGSVTEGLQEVTLTGYKEIYISDCPYLNKIVINDPETVENIYVRNSASLSSSLQINSNTLYTLDLSKFKNLKTVSFYNTKKFNYVYLSDNVELRPSAFALTNIMYLSGNNIKLSSGAFQQSQFTLLQNDKKTVCSFNQNTDITNLSYTFYSTNISKNTFDAFNSQYSTLLAKITNASYMWAYSACTKYDETMLIEDYKSGKGRFDLSMYTNVVDATGMMGGYYVSACHSDTLKGFGASSVNLNNFYGWSNQSNKIVTVPLNWLQNVATKVTDCNTTIDSVIFKVVNWNGTDIQQVQTFSPKDFFQGNANNKLTSLLYWVFDSGHTLNLKDAFIESNFPKLHTINKSFCGCNAINIEYEQPVGESSDIAGFLYSNSKIKYISGSFGFNNYQSLTVNLDRYLNWENVETQGYSGFIYTKTWDEKYHVLEFNKTISSTITFQNIYNSIINGYYGDSLSHVFQNCTLTNDGENIIFTSNKNNKITKIPYLFKNLKTDDDSYLNWDWDIMQTLPKVTEMQYTFSGVKFRDTIPFNFFKQRKLTTTTVYVTNELKEGTLYEFSYNKQITDLSNCFENCKFSVNTYINNSTFKDYNRIDSLSYISVDGVPTDYNIYYTSKSIYGSQKRITNTEFDDLGKQVSYASSLSKDTYGLVRDTTNWELQDYDNYQLLDSTNIHCPFIAPDIFYACVDSVKLNSCFSECELQGYIPDNLLKNCKNAVLSDFIKNVLILPKYYDTRWNENLDKQFKIYYYIGSNFCNNLTLDRAFNFRMQLPGNKTYDLDELFVLSFKDSFNKAMTSVYDMAPFNIKPAEENEFFTVQHYDNCVYLNMMYDKSTETTTSYAQDEDGNDITIDEEGNPIELKPIVGNLGFDLSYYSSLNADHLINGLFTQFTYGNVFDQYTTLNSIKKRYSVENSSWIIYFGNDLATYGVSKNAIWPFATSINSKALYVSYTKYIKIDEQWQQGGSNSLGLRVYKSNFNNYTDVVPSYYNNSRSNSTGWELNFIV